jgi:uncharacterized protein (TIGR00369 family)
VWLRGKVVAAEEGILTMSFIIRQEMTNPFGILHGGVTAGMIDDVMGTLFFTLGTEYIYPTINLSIDYFASGKVGETVSVTAKVIRQGKTIINLYATMQNQKNVIIAQATSNLAQTSLKMPA